MLDGKRSKTSSAPKYKTSEDDGDPSAEIFFVKFSKMVRKNNFEKKNGNRALPE